MKENAKRIARWTTPTAVPLFTVGTDNTPHLLGSEVFSGDHQPAASDFIRPAKELIFDIVDGSPVFHVIIYTFREEDKRLFIQHYGQILCQEDSAESTGDAVKCVLALARAYDVPVYPNDSAASSVLLVYYKDFLLRGCTMTTVDAKYRLTQPPPKRGRQALEAWSPTEHHSSVEMGLLRESILQELERYQAAARVLDQLATAISELETQLGAARRNEAKLQKVLTRNPILFGPAYVRIIAKHMLGSEYEMDYALVRVSGLVDLVEIEASSHRLFNRNGDPSGPLVHAERQVLDWQEWIARHNEYARVRLPGAYEPVGFVVIGRRSELSEESRERLRRRNTAFRNTLEILTYDDVLDRARNLLRLLQDTEPLER